MTTDRCPREDETLAAVDSGDWTRDLQSHREDCDACAEAALIGAVLRRAAAGTLEVDLPDPGYLWWRARLEGRDTVARRATRAIAFMQGAAWTCGGLVGAFAVTRLWPRLQESLARLNPPDLARSLPTSMGSPALVLFASAGLLALIVLANLGSDWAGE